MLLTTQYLEEADRLADTLVVLDHGQVIAEGTPTQLKADLGATVLEVGLGSLDDAARTAELLAGLGPHVPAVNGTVVEVTVDQGPEAAMASLRSLDQAGIVPTTFTLREPSLDDVFLALTGRRTEEETEDQGEGPDGRRTRLDDAMPRGPRRSPQESSHDHRRRRPDRRRRPPLGQHREPGPLGRLGHADRHQAEHPQLHPHPRGPVLLHRAADHVRAAVPLRVRRGHQRPRHHAT